METDTWHSAVARAAVAAALMVVAGLTAGCVVELAVRDGVPPAVVAEPSESWSSPLPDPWLP